MTKNKNKIQPLGDRVLVKPVSSDNHKKTKSGIFIPDTISKEKPEQGEVVAVGPGLLKDGKLVPVGVKVGDTVMFSKYGYDEIKIDEVEYFIIKEENVLAIIN